MTVNSQSQKGNGIAQDTRLLTSVFKIRNANALNPRISYHLNLAIRMTITVEWYVPVAPALSKLVWDGKIMLASFSQTLATQQDTSSKQTQIKLKKKWRYFRHAHIMEKKVFDNIF